MHFRDKRKKRKKKRSGYNRFIIIFVDVYIFGGKTLDVYYRIEKCLKQVHDQL